MSALIDNEQAWRLYQAIVRSTLVGKRDLAVLATLIYSGARAGAPLDLDDLYQDQGDCATLGNLRCSW